MYKQIYILLFYILIFSCKSEKFYVYVSNSNNIELKNLNYKINSGGLVLLSDSISYTNVNPSNKEFVLHNLDKKDLHFNIEVEGRVIKQILINKYDNYLFISIFYDEVTSKYDVYYITSKKKIIFR